ncbi:hypothetical protein [Pustulibacterium marinum]|nr:hypothetical protein [Pustulibacterium marinum]
MKTNVRSFTDKELLDRVEAIGGKIPNRGKYLCIGVQSKEDQYNVFDDKFYLYDGCDFVMVSSGTTNAGSTALKTFDKYNLEGAAVWRTDQFVEDCFAPGLHKSKMKALRQHSPIEYYRDSNKDNRADQTGKLHKGIIWANMHGVSYDAESNIIKTNIGGWSFACQVWNNMPDYHNMIDLTWKRDLPIDYALLKEF